MKNYRFRYCVWLEAVTGIKKDGGYFYGSSFSSKNFDGNLSSVKLYAREHLKTGEFNHAIIFDREAEEHIECFTGTEWRTVA